MFQIIRFWFRIARKPRFKPGDVVIWDYPGAEMLGSENAVATKNFSILKMYQKEHDKFKNVYYQSGLCDFFWVQLDKLIKG